MASAVRRAQRQPSAEAGEDSADDPAMWSLEVDSQRLLTVRGIGRVFGMADSSVRQMVKRDGFPPRAAKLGKPSLWHEDDVRAFRTGRSTMGHPNLDDRVLSAVGVADRLGITHTALDRRLERGAPNTPQPAGALAGLLWWDADLFGAGWRPVSLDNVARPIECTGAWIESAESIGSHDNGLPAVRRRGPAGDRTEPLRMRLTGHDQCCPARSAGQPGRDTDLRSMRPSLPAGVRPG